MHQVSVEKTRFFYFTQSDDPAEQASLPVRAALPDPRVIALTGAGVDTRQAIFESMLDPNRGRFYVLCWSNGQDLADLDHRVADGSYSDVEFKRSVRTVYQDTVCDSCHEVWPTLVIPPGDPYPGAPGLLERKIAANQYKRCPKCNAPFRQLVVKVFGI